MDHIPIQHRPPLPSLQHFSAVVLPNRSHIPPHFCQQLGDKGGALSEEADGVIVRCEEDRGERENGRVECRSLREARSARQQFREEPKRRTAMDSSRGMTSNVARRSTSGMRLERTSAIS